VKMMWSLRLRSCRRSFHDSCSSSRRTCAHVRACVCACVRVRACVRAWGKGRM
jgi:hypothetical protein